MSLIAVGIGAGLVSALLFAVVIKGSSLALLLSLVAPLPVFIAAMGWNHRAGLVAAAAGGLVMAFVFRPTAGLGYVIAWALPAWWLGYLALLGRPGRDGTMEWYPLGRLLVWMAATGAAVTLAFMVIAGGGDYEAFRTATAQTVQRLFEAGGPGVPQAGAPPAGAAAPGDPAAPVPGSPAGEVPSAVELARIFVLVLPLGMASFFVMILAANFWLAARVVSMSGRFARPWPFIPATQMPRTVLPLLVGSIGVGFAPGYLGVLGLALTGALTVAFSLQGLALIHDVSRGRQGRGGLLAAVYVTVVFLSQVALPLLALAGIADTAFGLRSRSRPGGPDPRPVP